MGAPVGEGYRFAVLGDHGGDVVPLLEHVRSQAQTELGRRYLERSPHRDGWIVGDEDEVAGRLVWNDDGEHGKPYDVVVDGRDPDLGRARDGARAV